MYKRTNNGVLNGGCLKCYYNLILILLFIYLFMYLFIYLFIFDSHYDVELKLFIKIRSQ
jgi:uncharacterized membrane protein YesL